MLRFVSHAFRLLRMATLSLCLATPLASHASDWVDTDTRAVALKAAIDLGAADASARLPLLVSLKLQNQSVLYGYFQHITNPRDPLYGHYLTPAQFTALYAPSTAATQQVVDYLSAQGFTGIAVSPNRTMIRMNGTVEQAQAAFNTVIHQLQFEGKTVLANVTPARVPAALGNLVLSVTGLNTVQYLHLPHRASTKAGSNGALPPGPPSLDSINGYSPQQYQKAYDVNPAQDASNTSIAIIAEGDLTTVLSDLRVYEDTYKLPHVPYTVIKTGYDHSDTSGADEFDLDTQSSTGIAGNVKHLYIYDGAALSDVELLDAYNHWINDGLASAASASIAGCESLTYAFGELSAYDQLFLQMATQGMTLFNSTGDSGSSCLNPAGNGIPAGVPGVEFPASSPYVVGVGGTTLLVNSDGSYNYESAWMDGGGGTSVFENAPAWQLPVLPTGAAGTSLRAVPDIAMDADANTGANVLASPLALGSWARIQSANNNSLGYAPPAL
jgi:pseudomonalisin